MAIANGISTYITENHQEVINQRYIDIIMPAESKDQKLITSKNFEESAKDIFNKAIGKGGRTL